MWSVAHICYFICVHTHTLGKFLIHACTCPAQGLELLWRATPSLEASFDSVGVAEDNLTWKNLTVYGISNSRITSIPSFTYHSKVFIQVHCVLFESWRPLLPDCPRSEKTKVIENKTKSFKSRYTRDSKQRTKIECRFVHKIGEVSFSGASNLPTTPQRAAGSSPQREEEGGGSFMF